MPDPQSSAAIGGFIESIRLAPRQSHKVLTLWPLVRREGAAAPGVAYVPLAEAIASGGFRVDEVDEHGHVPNLRVSNERDDAVLFLFGEEVRGAMQNRVANATFLVPAHETLVVDVSCVEAGRWATRSRHFEAADEVISTTIRRKMAMKVSHARSRGAGFDADQHEVWESIGDRLRESQTATDTLAYADYREGRSKDLEEVCQAFHTVENQLGFVAAIGDTVTGLEAIGRPEVFASVFQALLRSYAIDAVDAALVERLEGRNAAEGPHFDSPESFLAALASAPATAGPSLGLGEDLRLEGRGITGCALTHEGVVHLTAFPAEA